MSEEINKQVCGIVMPISAVDGCSESHWADVLEIITEAIEDAGFSSNLVSNADDVGIIHKRIIQNLYDNPVVVCDVSGKNPNVMFELGLRLAFDKPTVIIKDEKTSYSFDTSAIEHLEYPRDLRFSRIIDFKQKLTEKISATYKKSTSDPNYTTFLKHFGEFKVAKLEKKEVSGQEFILEELRAVRTAMRRMEVGRSQREIENPRFHFTRDSSDINICMGKWSEEKIAELVKRASGHPEIRNVRVEERSPGHNHLFANVRPGANLLEIEAFLGERSRQRRVLKKNLDKN